MLNWLTGRSAEIRKAGELYGKVVAAARQPAFYGPGRVADTPEGRFELVALHLFLIVERVKDLTPGGTEIARQMIEEAKTAAKAEGDREKAAAKSEIEQEVSRAKETLRTQVAALAVAGAEQILKREVDPKAHAAMLADVQKQL